MLLSGQFFSTSRIFPLEPENAPILRASLTNSWSVDNREKFLNIVNEKLVERPLIPLLHLKIHHGHVLLKWNLILANIKITHHNFRRKLDEQYRIRN
ncbi:hypothetical protein CsSME_00050999 [Camellia sinensis var. sinensis]